MPLCVDSNCGVEVEGKFCLKCGTLQLKKADKEANDKSRWEERNDKVKGPSRKEWGGIAFHNNNRRFYEARVLPKKEPEKKKYGKGPMAFGVSTVVHDENKGGMHWREKQKYKDAGKPLPKPVPKKEHREVPKVPEAGDSVFCPQCGQQVFVAEAYIGPGKEWWHKACFKCANCNRQLDPQTARDHDSLVYCSACHTKLFQTRGFSAALTHA